MVSDACAKRNEGVTLKRQHFDARVMGGSWRRREYSDAPAATGRSRFWPTAASTAVAVETVISFALMFPIGQTHNHRAGDFIGCCPG